MMSSTGAIPFAISTQACFQVSLLDECLVFAIKGFLLLHEFVALLGPCLDLFCTSLVLKLQIVAIFLHLLKVHFGFFLYNYKASRR
jgi:hypothetical protein